MRKDSEGQPGNGKTQRCVCLCPWVWTVHGREGLRKRRTEQPSEVTAVQGGTSVRQSGGTEAHPVGREAFAQKAVSWMPVTLLKLGRVPNSPQGLLTQNADPLPPRFSFSRSSVGPEKVFPGFQVILVWGPYFENHNFHFSPSGHFMFKPVDIFTQLILGPKVFPICV